MSNFARLIAASRADSDQSPRLWEWECKQRQSRSQAQSERANEGTNRASSGTIPESSGSTRVARSAGFGSLAAAVSR